MHLRLLAVGDRQPSWVDEAFTVYTQRLPREWKFRLDTVATVQRKKNDNSGRATETESDQLLSKLNVDEQMILLDERGKSFSSKALSDQLSRWHGAARDICFVIGGPDGVSARCRERASVVWSLSELTLPHGLARVLLAEQLYRAWSLQTGHPYHRE